jgi:hypothetical protein
MKTLTDDFCETFTSKKECVGAMAMFIPYRLPEGVDASDPRVKQIIDWCKENALESKL